MSKKVIVFLVVLVSTLSLKSQVTLNIVIKKLESNKGAVLMDFRDGEDKKIKGIKKGISGNECRITVNNLKAGKYSFKYFHDENNNMDLDTYWMGAPKEGMGFSNDAKGKFGPPKFKDTVFEITKDTTVVCNAYYIKF